MTKIHPKFGVAMTALQYAKEWQQNAEAFSSAGHYSWMSEQLGDVKRVIEVGCGSGASTEELLTGGRQILVIEPNEHCAKFASERLKSKGHASELISVDQLADLSSWNTAGAKFLVADVLVADVERQLPHSWFDAIVCWMIGSNPEHIGTALKKPYLQFDGSEMPAYRMKVQERCYKLGTHAMRREGIVHVVDRAAIRSLEDKDQMLIELAKMLSAIAGLSYRLSKDECCLRKLTEGLNHSNIQHLAQVPSGFNGVLILTSAKAYLA